MRWLNELTDWVDSRTGIRTAKKHLLDEPLPPGVGWWFVTGSVLLMLLGVQLVTGVFLTMYYVPSPEFAYDSVRYIMEQVTFGRVLRGLHFFGASFIVVAAVIHMLRVVALGSYKKPREVTWLTGVVLFLVILGFSLSGYLLPWDQKAYWATTVTINIAKSGPMGEFVSGLLQGGTSLGSLTLLRWYSAHVFLLPAALIVLVVAHLFLMRRHGISGSIKPVAGEEKPFYPYHAFKDTLVSAAVFSLLLTMAIMFRPPLDALADPSDASYIPRPEWYFLSLFQMLKYFPGPLEPVATMVIPGLVVGGLFALPFLDRSPERHFFKRPFVAAAFTIVGAGIVALTYLGFKDTPEHEDPSSWTPLAIAGREFTKGEQCATCHVQGGAANPLANTRLTHDPEWLLSHVRDPEVIAPGLRPPPGTGMSESQALAIQSYMKTVRAGRTLPAVEGEQLTAVVTFGQYCASCHMIDGEGGASAPDLSLTGQTHDAQWLQEWIADPSLIDPASNMPPFGDRLTEAQLAAISSYLAARK